MHKTSTPKYCWIFAKVSGKKNPYCNELRFLGAAAQEWADGIAVLPRMTDQLSHSHFDVCSVMNNRQTSEMRLQVETHTNSVTNICLDSEKVEGFMLLVIALPW